MKVAITSRDKKMNSKLDSRFGRCTYFAIYDTENHKVEFVRNSNKNVAEGAGPATVQLVASKGVNQVISGNFGGKVKNILESLKIQMIIFDDAEKTISEILNHFGYNQK